MTGRARYTLLLLLVLLTAAGLAVGAGGLAPRSASAHANLLRAEPAPNSVLDQPPDRVTIWFTEPLEPGFSEIQVLNIRAERVDNDDSAVDANDSTVMSVTLPELPNGTYTVAWHNLSTVDGHTVRSSFFFSVGEPVSGAPPPGEPVEQPVLQSPAEPALRWLVLVSALLVVGGLGFELLAAGPALARPDANRNLQTLRGTLRRRTARLLWAGLGLLLLASLGQLMVQAAKVLDLPFYGTLGGPVVSIARDTDWGHLWLWRIGLLLAVAAALGAGEFLRSRSRPSGGPQGPVDRPIRALALVLGAALLLTFSLASHGAATVEVRKAAIFSDYAHLLAAALWVGGLFQLALVLLTVRQGLSAPQRRGVLTALVPRFSVLAGITVGVLIITGLYSGWAQVTVPAAVATPYGWTLVVKVALVALLLVLGAANLLWVRPRLGSQEGASQWLRRLVTAEVALALLVLLCVGLMTSMEPARQVASRLGLGQSDGLTFQDTVEGTAIGLRIEPGRVGPNDVAVSLRDRSGQPITNAAEVQVGLVFLGSDLGENRQTARDLGEGRFLLEGAVLNLAGDWQVELLVRRPDAFDARTAFRFQVSGAATGDSGGIAPSADLGRLLWGVELVLIGVLLTIVAIPLGGIWRRRGAIAMGSGLAAFFVGVALAVNTQSFGASGPQTVGNPFPPTAESLSTGREVYSANCLACHGESGRGDGPQAAGLDPPPADLVVHVPLHFDQALFGFVENGIPSTAMPALGGQLTDEEIWHLINYLKTLEPATR